MIYRRTQVEPRCVAPFVDSAPPNRQQASGAGIRQVKSRSRPLSRSGAIALPPVTWIERRFPLHMGLHGAAVRHSHVEPICRTVWLHNTRVCRALTRVTSQDAAEGT